jgi:DNA-binding MarR family transcriptional regulator
MTHNPLKESTGYLLARICRLVRIRAHAMLDEVGLYRGQHFVLRALWAREGITHSELAGQLNVQPATVTNTLKRMEKAGLVERRRDTEDERVSRVYLTEVGRDIRASVERVWRELEAQTFAGFTQGERDSLDRLLIRLYENLVGSDEGDGR